MVGSALRRYASNAARQLCSELQADAIDLCCPAEDLDNLPEVLQPACILARLMSLFLCVISMNSLCLNLG